MSHISMSTSPPPLVGGIEAGGTKFVCTVGRGPDQIQDELRFPTTTPDETLARTVDFFRPWHERSPLAALGIGTFGPADVDSASPRFGHITSTPKPGWRNTDFVGPLRDALDVPIAFDTDVNAAALGEYRWGAAQGLDTFVYLTIGTGIGGGGMVGGTLMHGLVHPEMGHMLLPHDRDADPFEGVCPFHGDCWEGLAAGPALEARWGQPGHTLPETHEAWDLEAHYIALGLVNLICALSPERLILGGGVMQQAHLFPRVRTRVQALLNGYVQDPALTKTIDDYIVPPQLGPQAGMLGAIALALEAVAG